MSFSPAPRLRSPAIMSHARSTVISSGTIAKKSFNKICIAVMKYEQGTLHPHSKVVEKTVDTSGRCEIGWKWNPPESPFQPRFSECVTSLKKYKFSTNHADRLTPILGWHAGVHPTEPRHRPPAPSARQRRCVSRVQTTIGASRESAQVGLRVSTKPHRRRLPYAPPHA